MQLAAAVQVLLADAWLQDKRDDGNQLAALPQAVLARHRNVAAQHVEALGVDASIVLAISAEQCRAESVAGSVEEVSAPTEKLLGRIIAGIARIDGVPRVDRLDRPLEETLSRLGKAVGRVVYLVDALDDLASDWFKGDFNPLIERNGEHQRLRRDRLSKVIDSLDAARRQVRDAFDALPLHRHFAALDQVLLRALPQRIRSAITQAVRFADAHEETVPRPTLWARLAHGWTTFWEIFRRTFRRSRPALPGSVARCSTDSNQECAAPPILAHAAGGPGWGGGGPGGNPPDEWKPKESTGGLDEDERRLREEEIREMEEKGRREQQNYDDDDVYYQGFFCDCGVCGDFVDSCRHASLCRFDCCPWDGDGCGIECCSCGGFVGGCCGGGCNCCDCSCFE